MNDRVLLVDDEVNVLQGFKRNLRKDYNLETAIGASAALDLIRNSGPFAVVVTDMQMPEVSGVELLAQVSEIHPHTIRIMLTGNADQKTAVDAVNQGHIFRFLNKPCPPQELAKVLNAGLEQYRLITAEAELLNKTLAGSVQMLTQVLSLAMPEAFGLTQEARKLARFIAGRIGVGPLWQVEMAAMLMRVGCVSLPSDALTAFLSGDDLSPAHAKLVTETPKLGHSLLTAIPRLEPVAKFVLAQNDPPTDPTPIAARILRVIGDYQRFASHNVRTALERLRSDQYDSQVVSLLAEALSETCEGKKLTVAELKDGMVLAANVVDNSGRLLIAKGIEVHQAMIQKLVMLRLSSAGVCEPIEVRVAQGSTPQVDAALVAAEVSQQIFQE
ncbi:MAG: response regulator [Pirellulaceae bacterium]